jgi:uncharacterized hydrophobic protein (TIGR00271 family)
MFEALFHNVTEAEKNEAIENIIQHATPRQDFFLMLTLAVSMAVFAVLLGSTAILIASMLIAPLLFPLLSLSLGIIASDQKLITRSVLTLGKSLGLALAAGTIIGFIFGGSGPESFPLYIAVGGASSLMYAIVAAIAGFAAAFAMTKPHLNETLPGIAIAVALVPPLAFAGIGISFFDWPIVSNSLQLFFVNVIGIMFSAMIVFSMLNFAVKKKVTQEAVKEEEKIIKKETEVKS